MKKISETDKFLVYRDLKINQRIEIVKNIMAEFPKSFSLFGDEWKDYFQNTHKTIMEKKKYKIYIVEIYAWILVQLRAH